MAPCRPTPTPTDHRSGDPTTRKGDFREEALGRKILLALRSTVHTGLGPPSAVRKGVSGDLLLLDIWLQLTPYMPHLQPERALKKRNFDFLWRPVAIFAHRQYGADDGGVESDTKGRQEGVPIIAIYPPLHCQISLPFPPHVGRKATFPRFPRLTPSGTPTLTGESKRPPPQLSPSGWRGRIIFTDVRLFALKGKLKV